MSDSEVIVKDKCFTRTITSETIQQRVAELAAKVNSDYQHKKPVFIGVLTGSVFFAVDLLKNISVDCEVSFIRVASYQGINSTGEVTNIIGLKEDIKDRDVLIIEDIIDTGNTVSYLIKELSQKKPASIKIATALFKPKALLHEIKPHYIGFEIEPDFVVGYGLDYDGFGRNLNDIYVLKP